MKLKWLIGSLAAFTLVITATLLLKRGNTPTISPQKTMVQAPVRHVPNVEALPPTEDLQGTSLQVRLSEDGYYELLAEGEPREEHEVLVADDEASWSHQEQDLLYEINDGPIRLDEGDKSVISAWRKSLAAENSK